MHRSSHFSSLFQLLSNLSSLLPSSLLFLSFSLPSSLLFLSFSLPSSLLFLSFSLLYFMLFFFSRLFLCSPHFLLFFFIIPPPVIRIALDLKGELNDIFQYEGRKEEKEGRDGDEPDCVPPLLFSLLLI